MDKLEDLRGEIDEIDRQLVRLFEARMERVLRIGEHKRKNQLPIFNAAREEEVLRKNVSYLENSDFQQPLQEFFRKLMDISKEIQKSQKKDHNK